MDDREEAIMSALQGVPIPTIAKELGVSESTIYRWMREGGHTAQAIKIRHRRAIDAYLEGEKVYDILDRFSMSTQTLYSLLKQYDVPYRHGTITDDEKQLIIDMYKAGAPLARIRKETGRALQSIYDTLEEHNVRLRQYSVKRGE